MSEAPRYYVPHTSKWPIIGSSSLFVAAFGTASFIQGDNDWVFYTGLGLLVFMMFGWFRDVVAESVNGMMSGLMDVSYRQSMAWFIVSEVFFFGAFLVPYSTRA